MLIVRVMVLVVLMRVERWLCTKSLRWWCDGSCGGCSGTRGDAYGINGDSGDGNACGGGLEVMVVEWLQWHRDYSGACLYLYMS